MGGIVLSLEKLVGADRRIGLSRRQKQTERRRLSERRPKVNFPSESSSIGSRLPQIPGKKDMTGLI